VYIKLPGEPGRPFGNPPLGAMAFVDERGNNGEDGLGRDHLVLARDPHEFIDPNAIKMVPLKSERRCIRLGRDETENVPDVENSSGQPAHTRLPSAISPFSAFFEVTQAIRK
jgi:hypothetical protein